MLTFEHLLSHFEGVQRYRDGYIARCPAHRDRSPSLSISESGDRFLLHCFAGCTSLDICKLVGIKLNDLFKSPKFSSKPESPKEKRAREACNELRSVITKRERVLPITVLFTTPENLDHAIARALGLAVEQQLVRICWEP